MPCILQPKKPPLQNVCCPPGNCYRGKHSLFVGSCIALFSFYLVFLPHLPSTICFAVMHLTMWKHVQRRMKVMDARWCFYFLYPPRFLPHSLVICMLLLVACIHFFCYYRTSFFFLTIFDVLKNSVLLSLPCLYIQTMHGAIFIMVVL